MCLSRPSLTLPQFGDFGRVERILELHVDPRAGQDAPRVVLAPEGTGGLGRGGGEKRAGQPERAVIQFVSAPRRVPEERTARLAVAIGEVSPDLKPPGIVDAAGDEGGRLRARRIREHPAAAHAPAPPRSWGCRSRRSIVIVSSSVVHRTMRFQINPRNRRHKAHVQRKVCIRMQTDIHFQLSQHPIHPHGFKTLVE